MPDKHIFTAANTDMRDRVQAQVSAMRWNWWRKTWR